MYNINTEIAILIPCFNEELTIGTVIKNFKNILPGAQVYIFDNNSTDRTAEISKSLSAIVIKEKLQGKGYVVQSMFNKINAEIYIIIDGDNTYDISRTEEMIFLIENKDADMVIGNRLNSYSSKSFRSFHLFGNKLITFLINKLFNANLKDVMSGFRIMNNMFVKNINLTSPKFEIETEMTIKALYYGFAIKEVDIKYKERPDKSHSKLNTFDDGLRVLITIFVIFKEYKPLVFFSILSLFLLLSSFIEGFIVINEYIKTGFITRIPLAILASGSMILSMIFFVTAIIMDSINNKFNDLHHHIRINKDL